MTEMIRRHDDTQGQDALRTAIGDMVGEGDLLTAMGLDRDGVIGLAALARELVDQGRIDDAKTLLEGLVVLDPGYGFLHTSLGTVYMQLGLREAASAELHYALRCDGSDVAALVSLGELELEAGDLEAAATHLGRAVELDPEMSDPFANRARALAALVASVAARQEAPAAS